MVPAQRGLFCTPAILVLLSAAGVLVAAAPPQQKQALETKPAEYVPDLMRWIAEHYDVTKAYQAGDAEGAMRMLSQRTITEQRQIVERVIGVLETMRKTLHGSAGQADASRRQPGVPFTSPSQNARPETGATPKNDLARSQDPPFTWTVDLMRVAGSLHMDAALQAYRRDDASSAQEVGDQIKIARGYFGYYELRTGRPTESGRWQRAIGLTAMADGRFGQAVTILDDACAQFADDAPLHLACGSIHETIAMMPADVAAAIVPSDTGVPIQDNPLTEFDESRANRYRGGVTLARATASRDARLKAAARAFDVVRSHDRSDMEAQVRLAHVRMLQGNDKAAAELLEPLVAGPADTPPRIAYLSRLYLAEIRARQRGHAGAAAPLLEEAIALMPSGRSAYVALASVARSAGRQDDMDAALHRMLRAPRTPDDPWIGYRFGQFWVPDRLIAALRAEAQQQ